VYNHRAILFRIYTGLSKLLLEKKANDCLDDLGVDDIALGPPLTGEDGFQPKPVTDFHP